MNNLAFKPIFLHGLLAAIGFAGATFGNYLTELAYVPHPAKLKGQIEQSIERNSRARQESKHGIVIA